MEIIYHEKVKPSDLPKDAVAESYLFCIKIKDVNTYAKVLLDEINNTSWISELDFVAKMSYEKTANKTIRKLVTIFQSIENEVTASFGEFMISMSSGKCLKEKHSHKNLPLSELWKEKLSNNPGFDFHTLSPSNKFSFGESKYQSSDNAYPSAAKQTHRFSKEGKDKNDAVHLEHFGSPYAIKNLHEDKKGYVVAFSINSDDHKKILANSLKNSNIKSLSKRCDELYIIGVKI